MSYSKAHQKFADYLDNPEALMEPQDFLGPNYETVLNFWKWIESLNQDQFQTVADRYLNLGFATIAGSRGVIWSAAESAAGEDAGDAAWDAAWNAASYGAKNAVGYATWELISMHKLFEQGKTLIYVPLFDSL